MLKSREVKATLSPIDAHAHGVMRCTIPPLDAEHVQQCFSTGVPRVAAGGSPETSRNCLGRNSQPQLYAVVAV